jgi:hypothetical protein
MSLVEAWSMHVDERASYRVYSHEGRLIRDVGLGPRQDPAPGSLLLGRYLCDGELTLIEQYALLGFLRAEYGERGDALRAVIECLVSSHFLVTGSRVVDALQNLPLVVEQHAALTGDATTLVRGVLGESTTLRALLSGDVLAALGYPAPGFGRRRYL